MNRPHTSAMVCSALRVSTKTRTWGTLAIVVIALALRIYRLDAQSLWLDEGSTWAIITQRSWSELLGDIWSPSAAYPAYHLLLKGWVAIAGDGEWALRFPSALAGAGAVLAIMLAAAEVARSRKHADPCVFSVFSGLVAATSPYAIWQAQDAKVYSLLICIVALLLYIVLRTVRHSTRQRWMMLVALALLSLFVHRLALLALAGLALGLSLWSFRSTARARGIVLMVLATIFSAGVVYGLAGALTVNGWQESGHSAATSLQSLWLDLMHFALDRGDIGGYLHIPRMIWAAPALMLTAWAAALLIRDALRGVVSALIVLCMFALPLLLIALALVFSPIYEARYVTVAFPAWVLLLTYPLAGPAQQSDGTPRRSYALAILPRFALAATILVNLIVLVQPQHGLFSGAAVKEQWRDAVRDLAEKLHPDDLLIVHPYYTLPLWDYYAPRVSPDPLPKPVVFTDFSESYCAQQFQKPSDIRACFGRQNDQQFLTVARGKHRAFLLIAPDHANTIDRPKTYAEAHEDWELNGRKGDEPQGPDTYGWIGLRFAFPQRTWPCGGKTFVGVETMCQSYPSAYGEVGAAARIDPSVPLEATFGGEIKLRGYSFDLLGGNVRPGGTLPITLYWEALVKPRHNYSMFLHLCKECDQPPVAGLDFPPLEGYAPAGLTTTWQVGDPVHDERSLILPHNLPPGHYTLLLGVRPLDGDPAQLDTRLPVVSDQGQVLGGTRLVLGQVTVER